MGPGILTVRKVCGQAEHTGPCWALGRVVGGRGTGGRQAEHTVTGGRQAKHIGPCRTLGRFVGKATIVC
jgi:hypothetical protein